MVRREYALEAISKAKTFVVLNNRIEKRAKKLNTMGIKPLDALHLASAEEAQAVFFCTCDDKFLNRAKAVNDLKTKAVSPVELIEEIEK